MKPVLLDLDGPTRLTAAMAALTAGDGPCHVEWLAPPNLGRVRTSKTALVPTRTKLPRAALPNGTGLQAGRRGLALCARRCWADRLDARARERRFRAHDPGSRNRCQYAQKFPICGSEPDAGGREHNHNDPCPPRRKSRQRTLLVVPDTGENQRARLVTSRRNGPRARSMVLGRPQDHLGSAGGNHQACPRW
jgi:hypothetical protein